MTLSNSELNDLKTRCKKALMRGFDVGKGDWYLAELASEIGQKAPSVKASPAVLLDFIDQVEKARAGKPVQKVAPPPPPPPPVVEDDEDEEEGDEEEDEDPEEDEKKDKSSPIASKSSPIASKKKPPVAKKKKR